ncbi:MAG: SAM-dependent methyltransferase [Ilumatobacteraceae bacterium]
MSEQHLHRFDEFLELALYGPHGFYAGAGRAGRRGGDFLTSPEVGPLFGAVLARALDAWWRELGEPDEFTFVEAGAGPGTLARTIKVAEPDVLRRGALRYVAVEVSDTQRSTHPDWVTSQATMPDGPITGVIFANELLDNLPFRLAVFDGTWREAYAARDGDRWVERLGPLDDVPPFLPDRAQHGAPAPIQHGARAPIQTAAAEWVRDARSRLAHGRLVVVDYTAARTTALAMRPWREWLRTYRAHERGRHYLLDVGEQDITTEVCIDQLALAAGEPDAVRTQAQFLQLWGIEHLVDEGRRSWEEHAARPTLTAMAGRSRLRESEALLDPEGLGAFTVMEWTA